MSIVTVTGGVAMIRVAIWITLLHDLLCVDHRIVLQQLLYNYDQW